MKIFRRFPMLGFILIVYDIIVLVKNELILGNSLFKIKMMSGAAWTLTVGDLIVAAGLFCLFIEIYKSTRTSEAEIFSHIFSTLVFVIYIIEFIVLKGAGTSVFFLLTLMSLFNVVAGFTITIKTARRDFALDRDSNIVSPTGS
ncbi:MAG: hypothetical protein NTW38_10575 [Candidatus Aminicenantes bacterium]|nr:hypothetical protein [Candidatus Aminicenantes bacterium]